MEWAEALEEVINRTGHVRYRELTADDHPDREHWRARMVEMATGEPAPKVDYPSRWQMARNLAGAAARAAGAAVTGGSVLVPTEVYEERLAVCRGCPNFDPGPQRCRLCGCHLNLKLRAAQEQCPDDPPRWGKWEVPKDDGQVA